MSNHPNKEDYPFIHQKDFDLNVEIVKNVVDVYFEQNPFARKIDIDDDLIPFALGHGYTDEEVLKGLQYINRLYGGQYKSRHLERRCLWRLSRPTRRHSSIKRERHGFIYVLKSDFGCKIGKASNPENRLRLIAVDLPFDVELFIHFELSDMHLGESKLHKHFASKRLKGEWFALTEADLIFIKGLNEEEIYRLS